MDRWTYENHGGKSTAESGLEVAAGVFRWLRRCGCLLKTSLLKTPGKLEWWETSRRGFFLFFSFFLQRKLWEMLCEQLHSPLWKQIHLYGVCYLVQLFTMKFNSEKGNEAVSFVCVSVFFFYYWICDVFFSFSQTAGTALLSAERGSVFSLTTPRLQVC